jgi:hypothetical protein
MLLMRLSFLRIMTMIKIKGIKLCKLCLYFIIWTYVFFLDCVTCDFCKQIQCWLCRMSCIWSRSPTACVFERKNEICSLLRNVFVYFVVTLLVSNIQPMQVHQIAYIGNNQKPFYRVNIVSVYKCRRWHNQSKKT